MKTTLRDKGRKSRKPDRALLARLWEFALGIWDDLCGQGRKLWTCLLALARKRKTLGTFDVTVLLTNLAALMAVRFVNSALADYERRQGLHRFSLAAIIFLTAALLWEGFCLLVRLHDWEKANGTIRKKRLALMRTKERRWALVLALFLVIFLGLGFHFRWSTRYYASLTEIYGVPVGAGEPLTLAECRHLTGYWKVVNRPGLGYMTLSYENDWGQVELMRHYSSAYGMDFFQPPARIEVDYQTTEDMEFYRQSGWEGFFTAKSHNFKEPTRIRYFGSNRNLLLEMTRSGQGLMKITAYASEERPQLFNSTLLLFPEEEEADSTSRQIDVFYGAGSLPAESSAAFQQIETLYNSRGLPEIRRLNPQVYNRYGVNGERYSYDTDGRISALCYLDIQGEPICNKLGIMTVTFHYDTDGRLCGLRYYSDQERKEKTEGFHGVFYEDIHYNDDGQLAYRRQMDRYNDDGQLAYRRQMDRNENWCQDKNGVYKYAYSYDPANGRLIREDFFGAGDLPVRSRQFFSTWIGFSMEKSLFRETALEISLESTVTVAEEEAVESGYPQPDSETPLEEEPLIGGGGGILPGERENRTSAAENSGRSPEPGEDARSDTPRRAYTIIRHEFRDGMVWKIRYLDSERRSAPNEQGCEEIRLEHEQGRLRRESYHDADGNPRLIRGGYAAVYRDYEDGKLLLLEYRGIEDRPVTNRLLGYASVTYCRDIRSGQETVREYYTDPERNPAKLADLGCTSVERSYNASGQLISETYYDKENQPVCRSGYGVFQVLYEYADDGNMILECYKDLAGRPVNRLDTGCAAIHWSFENGRMTQKSFEGYRDGALRPTVEKESGAASIKYQYENGRQVQVRFFGVNGEPVLRNGYGCASWRNEYENGRLSARYYYGPNGKLLARNDTGYAVIRYTYDGQGRRETIRYYGENQEPVIHNEYACAGFKYEYDGAGNEWKMFFLGPDGENMLRGDGYGFAYTEKNYNDEGVLTGERFFGLNDEPMLWKERGYASFKFELNEDGSKKEAHFYDEHDNPTRRNDYGYATVLYTYDDEGRLESERYRDERGRPVISPYYQCAGFFYDYNKEGQKILVRYLGLDENALIRPDLGFAEIHMAYDPRGNLFSKSYFAADGKTPALYKGRGYTAFEDIYDESGHCVENRYYSRYQDGEKVLTIRTDRGYAIAKHWYNDAGLLKKTLYYDGEERPVLSWQYRCAGFSYEYDQRSRQSLVHFLGTDGKPMLRPDYCDAAIRKSYDGAGNLTGEVYLDLAGRPAVWSTYGYASYTKVYQAGKHTETRYFDAQGNPVLNRETGCAAILLEYDDLGRLIAERYYGKDDEPVLHKKEHCAGFQYGYDDAWNRTDTFYLHPNGGVMIREDKGYAHIHSEYNSLGEAEKIWYYADAGEKTPAAAKEGAFHHIRQKFAQGTCVMRSYFDENEAPMLRADEGYAAYESRYNQFGQLVRERYYGLAEEPDKAAPLVICRSRGCAGFVYRYDGRGNRTDIWCTAPDFGWMVQLDKGYAHACYDYDELDHLSEERYYLDGGDARPAVWIESGYARATFLHDAQGNLLEAAYFGPDGHPVLRNNYGAAQVKNKYDPFGKLLRTLYFGREYQPICTSEWHCAGFQYDYDVWGNQTDIWFLGLDEKPMVRSDKGYAHEHSEYDAEGNEIQRQYFNEEEQPAYHREWGYSSFESRYEDGNCVYRRYFDAGHRPTLRQGGYSAYEVSFQKGCQETRYLDEENRPILLDGNYAALRQEYDELGREISRIYLDGNMHMVLHKTEGCAGYRYAYDDFGNRSDVWYLGLDGKPMSMEGRGVAHVQTKYIAGGLETEERFFDSEETAVAHGEYGYAVKKSFYKNGKLHQVQYLNTEETLCLREDTGCAVEEYDYNITGRLASVWYYGLEDARAVHKTEGYAGVEYLYDGRGNLKTIYYYGADRKQSPRRGYGVSYNHMVYDEYNHLILDEYFLLGRHSEYEYEYAVRKDVGYAVIKYIYDRELLIRTSYLDANQKPAISGGRSYATVKNEYDSNGQLERKYYFDGNDRLYDGPENYSVEEYRYDDPGGIQHTRYRAEAWNSQVSPAE